MAEVQRPELASYAPRLLLEWAADQPEVTYRAIEGTLVFADVSGFTKLSERLARAGGKVGAEQMSDVINALFGELLLVAAARGGEMLKYGGDAVLLFFDGPEHAPRGVAACHEMQRKLHEIGRVDTGAGVVRLRMSVGVSSGTFDFFKVGASHQELVVAGPATTECVAMEAAADATEVLLSLSTVEHLPASCVGREKAGGRLLRRLPVAPFTAPAPFSPRVDPAGFVPATLRSYLGGGGAEPDHRLATVAFLHLMDMDRRLQELGPAVVAAQLDETMQAVQEVFTRHGVSFLATDLAPDGTKVMAASGAPFAINDPAGSMLAALLALRDQRPPLPVRAGVNHGHVFSGDVGPPFRRTYTTIGDVTNTAARVLGRAEAGEILCLAAVTDHAELRFDVEERPPFAAKGKTEPLEPLAVIGARGTVGVETRLPFVGRRDELATLVEAFTSVAGTGCGIVVEVAGPPGIGKSRLIHEAAARAGAAVVAVESAPYDAASPYLFVKRLLALLRPELGGRPLESEVEEIDPSLRPWTPLIGLALDRPAEPTPEVDALDPGVVPERISSTLASLLLALAHEDVVWVVEDAQWVDEASNDVLGEVVRRIADHRLALCISRPEPAWSPDAGRQLTMELRPLASDDAAELVAKATGAPLLPQQRREVEARAAGNPLFLIGLAREAGEAERLPDSLEGLVGIELDRLPVVARRAVRRLAVLGLRAPTTVADHVVAEAGGVSGLGEALSGIVDLTGDEAIFRHPLYQEVAYGSLPYRLRRELHARALDAYEGVPNGAPIELLSVHAELARDDERTWRYAADAAAAAASKRAYLETATLARRAVDAARRLGRSDGRVLELHIELGDALRHTGQPDAAASVYRQAQRLPQVGPLDRAVLSIRLGLVREAAGDLDAAYRRYRSGLKTIQAAQAAEAATARIRLLQGCAQVRYLQGKNQLAVRLAREARRAAEEAADDEGIGQAYELLHLLSLSTPVPEGQEAGRKALEIYERIGRADWQAAALNNLGMDAYYRGDWPAALDLYQRSREHESRCGRTIKAATCAANIAEIWSDQGRLEEARHAFEDALRTFQASRQKLPELLTLANLGRVAARLGAFEEADAYLAEALEGFTSRGLGASSFAAEIEAKQAEALVLRGAGPAAIARLDALLARPSASALAPALHRLRGWALLQAGDRRGAIESFDAAVAAARAAGAAFDEALALDAIGVADADRAERAAADATARLADLGVEALTRPPLRADGVIT